MELKQAREYIDNIDKEIIKLLARRFSIAKEIAKIKKEQSLPIQNNEREEEVIKKAIENLKEQGYDDEEFARGLFTIIMNKSKEIQKEAVK
ncbi:MAG: chorismate mutase [Nanoarchaeota archaeon]|nr:chorismate mutase [Nanoarchaeota archaeon]